MQSLACVVRQCREVSQSRGLQNMTHLLVTEDTAALEPHKLGQGEKPQTHGDLAYSSQIFPVSLLCLALGWGHRSETQRTLPSEAQSWWAEVGLCHRREV